MRLEQWPAPQALPRNHGAFSATTPESSLQRKPRRTDHAWAGSSRLGWSEVSGESVWHGTSLEACRRSCLRDSLHRATARCLSRHGPSSGSDHLASTSTCRSARHDAATAISTPIPPPSSAPSQEPAAPATSTPRSASSSWRLECWLRTRQQSRRSSSAVAPRLCCCRMILVG